MEILVCIKQVPDDSVEIKLDPSTGEPNLNGVESVVNAFDTYALEMATRLKEAHGGNVTVATIGDDSAAAALKSCLAVGGNKAFLIKDDAFADSDTTAKAYILSKAIAKIEEINGAKFDIVFCGKEATDFSKGMVGVQLAAELGVGAVTDVIAVDPVDGGVSVKQETETGYNVVEMTTPCVVTVQKPDYDPRYPTIKSKMAARKATINEVTAADIAADAAKIGEAGSLTKVLRLYEPPKKQAGIKIQEETVADSTIRAVAIMAEAKVL
jgi:electron transfer flavoprotein beta subunit